MPSYVQALCREIEWVGALSPAAAEVHTVYFGGGTPSLLSASQFETILEAIRGSFHTTEGPEITMEANPGTVSGKDLRALRGLGINRISLGVQSANGEELRLLERTHTFLEVLEAVTAARRAGFDNLSLDLIYGLPEQTLETWQTTVRRALELKPVHLSAYALTLEHGTPFGRWAQKGLMPMPDPDAAADMYEWASAELEAAGYGQYEISNWARPGRECRHNLQYWRGLPYLGFGAGAHGYANGYRYSNVLSIKTYIDRLQEPAAGESTGALDAEAFPISPAAVNQHRQTSEDDMAEYMIMGLRLTREGITRSEFECRFGVQLEDRFGKEIGELTGLGLLESGERGTVLLTRRGRLLGNQAFVRFVN